jgi:tRNA(Ile)-lysidine synthase
MFPFPSRVARHPKTKHHAPVSDLLQHVENSVRQRRLLSPGQGLLVAVSGGVDSMVLLQVLHSLARKNRWKIVVAHFNHRLRGRASDADEKLVRQTAANLRMKFISGGAEVMEIAAQLKISLEMAARKLRHEFLARTARELHASTIALAHHADDQVELFFLRLLRGAGGEGLAGMKWRSPSPADRAISLIRPLLDFSKADLLAFARENKIRFRDDATNFAADFLRNRIRNELLPMLRKKYQPGLDKAVLRLMNIVGAEAEFTGAAAREFTSSQARNSRKHSAIRSANPRRSISSERGNRFPLSSGERAGVRAGNIPSHGGEAPSPIVNRQSPIANFPSLPLAVQRKVLQQQLTGLGLVPDFELIEQLRELPGKEVSVCAGLTVARDLTGRVRCREHLSSEFSTAELALSLSAGQGRVEFAGRKLRWRVALMKQFRLPPKKSAAGSDTIRECFDAGKIGDKIILRHWRPGDRFQPIGLKSAAKLQDLFVNAKIPAPRRRELVLAATEDGEIFWVEGLRIGEQFKLTPATRRQLFLLRR